MITMMKMNCVSRQARAYRQMESIIMRIATLSALLFMAPFLFSIGAIAADGRLPEGWIKAGSDPADYDMGVDTAVRHSGKASGFIRAKADDPKGFATLMQTFRADEYRGKRLRLSGHVRADKIDKWAGLWMRIDGQNKRLGFDNMQDRAIKGTSDWKKYDLVLDVPTASVNIAFGILLVGKGQTWVDDLQFEVVGNDIKATNMPIEGEKPSTKKTIPAGKMKPVNLGFEK
jgi:hypothetical protein